MSSVGRNEMVEALARMRERELSYEQEDFDRWSVEVLSTWGLADRVPLRDRVINGAWFLGLSLLVVGFWGAVASLVF